MHRLLIADSSVKGTEYIKKKLCDDFEVAFCTDGRDLHSMMRKFDPDLLFLDLRIPNADGLTFLRDIRAVGNMIPIVVTASYLQDYVLANLYHLDVAAVLQKPWSVGKMLDEICQLAQGKQLNEHWYLEAELDYILIRLGFKAGTTRYLYTWHAVMERYKKENICLTKELYPTVARLVPGGSGYVEKGIRDGIRYARAVADPDLWQSFFPNLKPQTYPTNEEFLGRIAIALRHRERPRKRNAVSSVEAVSY